MLGAGRGPRLGQHPRAQPTRQLRCRCASPLASRPSLPAQLHPPSHPPSNPPQYVFSFSYDTDGEVHMAAGGGGGRGGRFSTKDATKVGAAPFRCACVTLAGQQVAVHELPTPAILCALTAASRPSPCPSTRARAGPGPQRRQVPGVPPDAHAGGDHQHAGAGGRVQWEGAAGGRQAGTACWTASGCWRRAGCVPPLRTLPPNLPPCQVPDERYLFMVSGPLAAQHGRAACHQARAHAP